MILNLFDRMKLPFRKNKEFLTALYNILGFYPHDIEVYRIAFAHKSLAYKPTDRRMSKDDRRAQRDRRRERLQNEPCKPLNNERLEFLGDAVLETVVSDIVFHHFDRKREGFLTATRSKIVQRETLNRLAAEMKLDKLIQAAQGTKMSHTNIGGNAFEALMGAIYLDRGFKFCHWFIAHRIIGPYIDIDSLAQKEVNFKSKLLEWCQKNRINQHFRMDGGEGDKAFRTTVIIEGLVSGRGQGHSKKESQQMAAKEALMKLRSEPRFYDDIFRAKEKRTAMEADESFALPGIDEIEESLRTDDNKLQRRRANLPILEGEGADSMRSGDEAYDDAYNAEIEVETISEPAAESADRKSRNRKPQPEDDEEEIDFYETTLEFPGDPVDAAFAEIDRQAAQKLEKRNEATSAADDAERKPKRKRKSRAERAKAAAERNAAEEPVESTNPPETLPDEDEQRDTLNDASQNNAPEVLTATIAPDVPADGEKTERTRRKRKRNRKAATASTGLEEEGENLDEMAENEEPEVENLERPDELNPEETTGMAYDDRPQQSDEEHTETAEAEQPVADTAETEVEVLEQTEEAPSEQPETEETAAPTTLCLDEVVTEPMPDFIEVRLEAVNLEPLETSAEAPVPADRVAEANSAVTTPQESEALEAPVAADADPEPVVSDKLHSMALPGEENGETPRPARKRGRAQKEGTEADMFDGELNEPEVDPELQNIVTPDFIEIALHAIDAEPEQLPSPRDAEPRARKPRNKPRNTAEKRDKAPKQPMQPDLLAPAPLAPTDAPVSADHSASTPERNAPTDASTPVEAAEGGAQPKRGRRRGHARPNPNKQ